MIGAELVSFLSENLSTLITPVQFIAGAVISAIFLRKKNSIETGTQEFEKIKAGHMKEAADALLASGKLTYTEYYKMSNFLEIAEKADRELKESGKTDSVSQQSFDWFMRFYEACGNISDDALQTIWAKILAGEIQNPGSCSFRTLECLKNISLEEALLFEKVCENAIRDNKYTFLPNREDFLNSKGIDYDDILRLEDCGLIKSDGMLALNIQLKDNNKFAIITVSKSWVFLVRKRLEESSGKPGKLRIPAYLFSNNGTELYLAVCQEQDNDFQEIHRVFNEWFPDYEFGRGIILRREGTRIIYQLTTIVESTGKVEGEQSVQNQP